MKILLIDPPFKRFTGFVNFYYPIGLAYLAAVLKAAGHEVKIYDVDAMKKGMGLDFVNEYSKLELYRKGINEDSNEIWQEIRDTLNEYTPDIVGITAMTTKFGSVLKTAEIVKKCNLSYKVIVGGPHPTLLPGQALKSEYIDIIVRGEGERTFINLVNVLENKGTLDKIKGISYKKDGKVYHNPEQEFIENLDNIPFPARDLLFKQTNYTSEDMGMIMTSRGCPFSCSYCCHMWQRKVRNRSIDNIIEEIVFVKDKYKTSQFEFKDDTFTINRERIIWFCNRIIDRKLNINWGCSTRVDLIDEELLRKMKKSGCNLIKIGIETGSEKMLKETNKGINFQQIRNAAKLLNKLKIFWSGYFMIGLPTETEEDIIKTYEFMRELNPYYAGLGVYNPFPKTELFNEGVRLGLLYPDVELSHFFEINAKNYFFVDRNRRVVNIEKADFDRISNFIVKGFDRHNKQLKNILRRAWIRKKTYMGDFKLLKNDIRKVAKWVLGKN